MASLQSRPGKDGRPGYRILFRWKDKLHSFSLDETDQAAAVGAKAHVEELLRLLKRKVLDLPRGTSIEDFLRHRGKPPEDPPPEAPKEVALGEARDEFLRVYDGSVEPNTLATYRLHLAHLTKTLGEKFPLAALSLKQLQQHVDRRKKERGRRGERIAAVTLRKEALTFSAFWGFARRMGYVEGEFPSEGLRYPKSKEPPRFMTRQEIERQLPHHPDPDELWDCLYLTVPEIAELLEHVKVHARQPFVYPMFAFACHTGARRSEMLRAEVGDVDFTRRVVTVREKKKGAGRGEYTTRAVPLTPYLEAVLKEWLGEHPGGKALFCLSGVIPRSKKRSATTGHLGEKKRATGLKARTGSVRERETPPPSGLTVKEAHDHFKRTLDDWCDEGGKKVESKWKVLKGWHVLRHSFISGCASARVDQRFIDDWVGHSTEQQRRRYRHLYPSTQEEAIAAVFGTANGERTVPKPP